MTEKRSVSGIIIGYDPGGAEANGVATLLVNAGKATSVSTCTLSTTEQVITLLEQTSGVVAIGIDSLTCWSTGPGGWRPADRWLRNRYRPVANSVAAPNGLRGSMAVNGMTLLTAIRAGRQTLFITETHPKVLLWSLAGAKYDYIGRRLFMDDFLARVLGINVAPANEHEWDAILSAFAALEGLSGQWSNDLHLLATRPDERLLTPCGITHYSWPEEDK